MINNNHFLQDGQPVDYRDYRELIPSSNRNIPEPRQKQIIVGQRFFNPQYDIFLSNTAKDPKRYKNMTKEEQCEYSFVNELYRKMDEYMKKNGIAKKCFHYLQDYPTNSIPLWLNNVLRTFKFGVIIFSPRYKERFIFPDSESWTKEEITKFKQLYKDTGVLWHVPILFLTSRLDFNETISVMSGENVIDYLNPEGKPKSVDDITEEIMLRQKTFEEILRKKYKFYENRCELM